MQLFRAFHGTDNIFSTFMVNVQKRSAGTNGGFWFSSDPLVANTYCNSSNLKTDVYFNDVENGELQASSIIMAGLSFNNPLIFDAKGNKSGDLYGYREDNDKKWLVGSGQISCYTIADLFDFAVKNGHDGVIVHNCHDLGGQSKIAGCSTIYGVKSNKQIND